MSCASRRLRLQRFFSSFPGGWPGLGLLILRIAVAFNAILCGVSVLAGWNAQMSSSWMTSLLWIVIGLLVLTGFVTPLASIAATFGYLIPSLSSLLAAGPVKSASTFSGLYLAAISAALALLGPGAFSVDARLFGRREIIIPEGRRPPSE